MNLSDLETRAAYHCVADVMRHRRRSGEPIPAALRELYARLDHEIRSGVERSPGDPATIPDPIGSTTAARLLDCSVRWIRHIATDLDGQHVDGRWIFSRAAVEEYAESRRQRPG